MPVLRGAEQDLGANPHVPLYDFISSFYFCIFNLTRYRRFCVRSAARCGGPLSLPLALCCSGLHKDKARQGVLPNVRPPWQCEGTLAVAAPLLMDSWGQLEKKTVQEQMRLKLKFLLFFSRYQYRSQWDFTPNLEVAVNSPPGALHPLQRWCPSPIPSSSISPPTMGSPFSLEREICSPGALYGL